MNQSNLQTAEEILNANKPYGRNWSEFLLPDQMEFLYRAMESYASQSLPQQPVSAGLRWVKASDRNPDNGEVKFVKYEDYKDTAYFKNDVWYFANSDVELLPAFLRNLEWLDENN